MRKSKISSFVVALIFIITSVSACFFSQSVYAASTTIEVNDDEYAFAKDVFSKINPNFPLNNADTTTRVEFTAAVTMLLNIPANPVSQTGFSDVAPTDKYAPYISSALGLGLVSNVDLFYPDSPITYAQAIKIVMSAVGYGKKAEYMGGYPTGYLKAASEAGVGKNLDLTTDATLSHEDAIKIIFDASLADMIEITGYGDTFEYSISKGKNILSEYDKIYVATGIVTANEFTGLYETNSVSGDDTISIDGNAYYGEGYHNLIGKNARIFFEGEKKREIIYAYELNNKILSFSCEDDLEISSLTLTADVKDSKKEARYTLENDYTIIYNGKCFLGSMSDYNNAINPKAGKVEVIDNDDNGKYDVISVKDITYGVISSVNVFDEIIYDKYLKNGSVDLGDGGVKYSITNDEGEILTLEDIEEGSNVGYIKSKDNKLIEIYIYSRRIGGTLSGITDDKIVVNEVEYELSDYYTSNIKGIKEIKSGIEVILHMGEGNQVISIEEFANSLHYGFIIASGREDGLGATAAVKICSDDGKIYEYNFADRVKIDGTTYQSSDSIKSVMDEIVSRGMAYRVCKYSVNVNGKVSKLFSATDSENYQNELYTETIDEARPVIFYQDLDVNSPISDNPTIPVDWAEKRVPMYRYGTFYPFFSKGSTGSIIRVPVRPSSLNDEKNFELFTPENSESYRSAAYDVDRGGGARFVLVASDTAGGKISETTSSSIVESVTYGLNEDEESVYILKLYTSGAWDKYTFDPSESKIYAENDGGRSTVEQTDITIEDIAPGDIVRFSANSDKEITALTLDFDCSQRKVPYATIDLKTSDSGGRYVEYIPGYPLNVSDSKQMMLATQMSIEEIDAVSGFVERGNLFSANFGRGTTIFVRLSRDRQTNEVTEAEVYTEKTLTSMETYFSAGLKSDFVVMRQRFHEPSLNIIYVNLDE